MTFAIKKSTSSVTPIYAVTAPKWRHLPASTMLWQHLPASTMLWRHLPASTMLWQHLPAIPCYFVLTKWDVLGVH